jgi:hypothetical protein
VYLGLLRRGGFRRALLLPKYFKISDYTTGYTYSDSYTDGAGLISWRGRVFMSGLVDNDGNIGSLLYI